MVVCDFCGRTPPEAADPPDEPCASHDPDEPRGSHDPDEPRASHDPDEPRAPHGSGEVPITWVTSVENGKPKAYCDTCSREHLRSIEAKLDAEWW